jgi:amidase
MTDPTAIPAESLLRAIATREISCAEVMGAFLDRIGRINPAINAIVALRPRDELMAEATMADNAPRRGPLHGLPFAIKDLVETAGIRTTHGSPLFADHVPQTDELLAARIRAAEAILIGKTNTPEFGLGSHSFNPVHGVTRNPYALSQTAGGSSGGAAAALATRLVPLADGSDTMGSLRNPAAFCNVYASARASAAYRVIRSVTCSSIRSPWTGPWHALCATLPCCSMFFLALRPGIRIPCRRIRPSLRG